MPGDDRFVEAARRLALDIDTPLHLGCVVFDESEAPLRMASPLRKKVAAERTVGIRVAGLEMVAASLGLDEADVDPLSVAYRLATMLQEDICVKTGQVWPVFGSKHDEILTPTPNGWAGASRRSAAVTDYGAVRSASSRTSLPDGTLRWWIDNPGWGVIASDGGDVVFHHADLRGPARQTDLVPMIGERLDYAASARRRGVYRKAESVALL